jgi:serine protease Do
VVRLHPEIAEVARQFVRVRLTRIEGMDLRRFEFDYDVTWYAFFLNADETIYGRYGGRDARGAEARFSWKGLRYAMERALEQHRQPPPPTRLAGRPLRAEDYPAAKQHRGCIHCHNINEFRRAAELAAGTWQRDSIWVYPLPENVGLVLDNDAGDRIEAVLENSPAARAGLRAGDRLIRLNGYTVASFADVSYALHKAPAQGSIPIIWERNGHVQQGELRVSAGWRKTNITWRPSLLDLLPALPIAGEDLSPGEKAQLGLRQQQAALRLVGRLHESLIRAGLQPGDVLLAVDGVTLQGPGENLLAYVRQNYLVGDTITLQVLRNGKRLELRYSLR